MTNVLGGMMTISRRQVLVMGSTGIPLAALAGCASRMAQAPPQPHSTSQMKHATSADHQQGVLVLMEGLGVVLMDAATTPGGAAIVLTNPGGITMTNRPEPLAPHHPTLAVPRELVAPSSTASPISGTREMVHYSLADMNVSFAVRTGPALDDAAIANQNTAFRASRTPVQGTVCDVDGTTAYNNVNWLLDIRRDLEDRPVATTWSTSKYVQAIVRFDIGSMEDPTLSVNAPGASPDTRQWQTHAGDTRTFKEALRHLIPQQGFLHITLTPRTGNGGARSVVVDASEGPAVIAITQLPKPGMPEDALDDLVSYLGLLEDGDALVTRWLDGARLPKPVEQDCGPQTFGCRCCPMGLIYSEAWSAL